MMRGSKGQGMASMTYAQATVQGKYPGDNTSGERSQGEVPGSGSMYGATLNERPNISNSRNQGPTREHSRLGMSTIPIAMMGSRNTGRM